MEQYEAVIISVLSKSQYVDVLISLINSVLAVTRMYSISYTVLAIYAEHIDGKNKRMMSQKHVFYSLDISKNLQV